MKQKKTLQTVMDTLKKKGTGLRGCTACEPVTAWGSDIGEEIWGVRS